jgi:hypothetical protein
MAQHTTLGDLTGKSLADDTIQAAFANIQPNLRSAGRKPRIRSAGMTRDGHGPAAGDREDIASLDEVQAEIDS